MVLGRHKFSCPFFTTVAHHRVGILLLLMTLTLSIRESSHSHRGKGTCACCEDRVWSGSLLKVDFDVVFPSFPSPLRTSCSSHDDLLLGLSQLKWSEPVLHS
jgi:hypothetical protein